MRIFIDKLVNIVVIVYDKKVKASKEYYDILCKDAPKRNNVVVKEEKKEI